MTRLTTGPSTTLFTDPKPNKRLMTELRTPEGKKKEIERGEKEGKREGRKRERDIEKEKERERQRDSKENEVEMLRG